MSLSGFHRDQACVYYTNICIDKISINVILKTRIASNFTSVAQRACQSLLLYICEKENIVLYQNRRLFFDPGLSETILQGGTSL